MWHPLHLQIYILIVRESPCLSLLSYHSLLYPFKIDHWKSTKPISVINYSPIFDCSGLIGRGFAMMFASAGYHVVMYDILPEQIKDALSNIKVS